MPVIINATQELGHVLKNECKESVKKEIKV